MLAASQPCKPLAKSRGPNSKLFGGSLHLKTLKQSTENKKKIEKVSKPARKIVGRQALSYDILGQKAPSNWTSKRLGKEKGDQTKKTKSTKKKQSNRRKPGETNGRKMGR